MSLGSLHYYLLLVVSGFFLLIQTAVKCHYHQQGSYHDSQSSFHESTSSFTVENSEFSADIHPNTAIHTCFLVFVLALTLIPLDMTASARHHSSTSRAPPFLGEE